MNTWTFMGHWQDGRIVVDYSLRGVHEDDRDDTGYWDEGLWSDSASAATELGALRKLRDEYEFYAGIEHNDTDSDIRG